MRAIHYVLSLFGFFLLATGAIAGWSPPAWAADTAIDMLHEHELEEAADGGTGDFAASQVDWEYLAIHGRNLALIRGNPVERAPMLSMGSEEQLPIDDDELAQAPQIETAEPADDADDVNDPLESMNRGIFAFNEFFLDWILGPISGAYKDFVPDMIREAIGNLLANVASPTILANDLLQFEFHRAWQTTERVVINSTVGLGGMIDVADRMGIPKHDEDFGQTLAVWGVGEGFYLVLPFFGPSNPRDGIGKGVDGYFDPLARWASNTNRDEINYGLDGANAVHLYSTVMDELAQIKKTSVDYYAALRSIYRQKRASEIRNGAEVDLLPIPNISYDLEKNTEEPTAGVDDRQPAEPRKAPQG